MKLSPIYSVSCSQHLIEEAAKLPARRRVDFVAAGLAARQVIAMQAHDMAPEDGHLRAPAMYLAPIEDAYTWQWLRECAKKFLAYARYNRVKVEIWASEAECPLPPEIRED